MCHGWWRERRTSQKDREKKERAYTYHAAAAATKQEAMRDAHTGGLTGPQTGTDAMHTQTDDGSPTVGLPDAETGGYSMDGQSTQLVAGDQTGAQTGAADKTK